MTQQKFKQQYTLQERIQKSKQFKLKYPNHVPLIIEELKPLGNTYCSKPLQKLILNKKEKIFTLYDYLRRRLEITKNNSLFVFINGNVICQHANISLEELQQKYKDEDGHLYIQCAKEYGIG